MSGWILGIIVGGLTAILTAFFGEIVKMLGQALTAIIDAQLMQIEAILSYSAVTSLFGYFQLVANILLAIGFVMAIVDMGIAYQNKDLGANIKDLFLNTVKGIIANRAFIIIPVFCFMWAVDMQDGIGNMIANLFKMDLSDNVSSITNAFVGAVDGGTVENSSWSILSGIGSLGILVMMIAWIFCFFKVTFTNLKFAGTLIIHIALGTVYMISIPRGYLEGFYGWCRGIVSLMLNIIMINTVWVLGVMMCSENLIAGLALCLAAGEVPKIAGRYGLDTSYQSHNYVSQAVTSYSIAAGSGLGHSLASRFTK